MDELSVPTFMPNLKPKKRNNQKNESDVFDRLYNENKKEDDIATIDTNSLLVTLDDKECENIMRNKIFKKKKRKCASMEKDNGYINLKGQEKNS